MNQVKANRKGLCGHEITFFEKGQLLIIPIQVLGHFELLPCLGGEKQVFIWHFQVLTE